MTILYTHLTRDEDIYLSLAASDIFDYYGNDHQIRKLCEECGEFISAAAKVANDPSDKNNEHLTEEFADVILVAEQIVNSLDASAGRKLAEIVMAKADRQLRRISKEKEEKEHAHDGES
jgi:NTP pyrophosphatase (non-canonical NTP hydrolase)